MPVPGNGVDIALRYAMGVDNYDHYIGQVAQTTAVDIDATTQAFVTLMNNEALRHKMGEAGKAHAKTHYDWPVIIRACQTLWGQLAELRKTVTPIAPPTERQPINPLRDDPYKLFVHYPSRPLHKNSPIVPVKDADKTVLDAKMNQLHLGLMKYVDVLKTVRKPTGVEELLQIYPQIPEAELRQAIGWFAKLGLVRI